jgi:hypothetical protein
MVLHGVGRNIVRMVLTVPEIAKHVVIVELL